MSYSVQKGKYVFHHHYDENSKKVSIGIGKLEGGEFVPNIDKIPKAADYHYKVAFENFSKARLLENGRQPSEYVFNDREYEEWKKILKKL